MIEIERNRGYSPLHRWSAGQALDHGHLNEVVILLQRLTRGVPVCREVRRQKTKGGGKGIFSWAILREVDLTTPLIKVQRIKYTDELPTEYWEAYSLQYPYHTYRKVTAYGDLVEVYPPPGGTYEMFNVPKAIRPVDEIPASGEKLGWTIYPVKLFADNTIEWALLLPPGVVEVDPDDEMVSA